MPIALSEREPTYHGTSAKYVLPNDSPEHERLNTQANHLSAIMNGDIVHAPLPANAKGQILDVGCGTGFVTKFLGTKFPQSGVCGLDLSPPPDSSRFLMNTRYVTGDILTQTPAEWRFAGGNSYGELTASTKFIYTFSRLLICGISEWSKYISTCFDLLQPGGYSEVHDLDWVWFNEKKECISDSWGWLTRLREVQESTGLDYLGGSRTAGWMKNAGFTNITVTKYYWPFGGEWENDSNMRAFGDYVAAAMPEMFHHLIRKSMSAVNSTEAEIVQMQKDMRRDFAPEKGKHWVFYVTYGQKPLT